MKKYTLVFATLCACVAISCNKEVSIDKPNQEEVIETPTVTMKTVTISATIEDDLNNETKSSYSNTGEFSWTAGDKISVLCTDGNLYEFTANSTGITSTFTGSIPDGYSLGARAFFPADAGHDSGHFNLPKYKDISSHDSADIPMVGSKGSGDTYSFVHCAGAALLTIDNIPDGVTAVTITVQSVHDTPSKRIKLSGLFWINDIDTSSPYWSGAYVASDDEAQYSRKVSVSDNSAKLYIPCPAGYNNTRANKLTITGHTSGGDIVLFNEKAMKSLGTVNRAHILPLKPLVYSMSGKIDWSTIDMYPGDDGKDAFPGTGDRSIDWKAVSDSRFIYIYLKYNKTESASQGSSQYIVIGFDLDNNSTTGDAASYVGQVEATAIVYPIDAYLEGVFTFDPNDAKNYIQFPVGTKVGTPYHLGSVDATYIYSEIAFDRTLIGSPKSGDDIGIIVSVRSQPAAEQTISLY